MRHGSARRPRVSLSRGMQLRWPASFVRLRDVSGSDPTRAAARAGGGAQLVPGDELDARATVRLARPRSIGVDRLPARVADVLDAAIDEQLLDRLGGRRRIAPLQQSGARVLEQQLDGLGRVLLVRADHAARAALDPARAVDAGHAGDASILVRDRRAPRVERDSGELDAEVADAAEDDAARDRLALVRRLGAHAAVRVGDQPVADHLDRLDALVAEDRDRRDAETQPDRAPLPSGRPLRVLAQHLDVSARVGVVLERRLARRSSSSAAGSTMHVGVGELAELLELRRGEGCLGGAAPRRAGRSP